jgi:hypothetical protein
MIQGSGLHRGRRRRRGRAQVDPMAGVANLADVMLVFACGLMIAIIMFWNVDLSNVVDTFEQDQLQEVDDPDAILQDDSDSSRYEEKGVIIQDSETGQMYLVEN